MNDLIQTTVDGLGGYTSESDWPDLRPILGDAVDFVLTYRGPLPSGSNDPRTKYKQLIRRDFHAQLKNEWSRNTTLAQWYDLVVRGFLPDQKSFDRRHWCFCHRGKFRFVPLVIHSENIQLVCHLDILFQRYDEPGEIHKGGDLDARLKVLFDALSIPQVMEGEPEGGEDPLFVLLEDDKLITELNIVTKKLLRPTADERIVELTIKVEIKSTETSPSVYQF